MFKSKNKNAEGKHPNRKNRERLHRNSGSLSQFGLLDVPDMDELNIVDDGNDLEAELLAITGGVNNTERHFPEYNKKNSSAVYIDRMVADCLRDDDDDDDTHIDEDDPELLEELEEINQQEVRYDITQPSTQETRRIAPVGPSPVPVAAGVSVLAILEERISMYKQAEANAISAGETSRARRFTRGLKTLNTMLKQLDMGKAINEEEIPPIISIKTSDSSFSIASSQSGGADIPQNQLYTCDNSAVEMDDCNKSHDKQQMDRVPMHVMKKEFIPSEVTGHTVKRPAPPPPLPKPSQLEIITTRHSEFKMAALKAKKCGDKEAAIKYLKIMKQLDPVLQAAAAGNPIDVSSLPPSPGPTFIIATSIRRSQETAALCKSEAVSTDIKVTSDDCITETAKTENVADNATSGGDSILQALEQRLLKYKEQRDRAVSEGNSRKERMNQRIMKQYQDAIKKFNLGKEVPYDELPTPPGFPPIPLDSSSRAQSDPVGTSESAGEAQVVPPRDDNQESSPPKQPRPDGEAPKVLSRQQSNVRNAPKSRVEKQLSFLLKRQKDFKIAALESKKRGEIEQAKEYLRNSLGLEQLIEATRNGLPVDLNTIPVPPQSVNLSETNPMGFEVVTIDDCIVGPAPINGDKTVAYTTLENDLIAQIKMCATTREHFKAVGDVASANRFEQLIVHTKKDLDAIRAAFKRGDNVPRFHYETRAFTMIQCNTDLTDSDCEVCVARGINYNVPNPKEVHTYIRIEFPFPVDTPPCIKTDVIKDSNNPEYNYKTVFSIDRKLRSLSRVFKRHSIKLQVYAKGGWFHRDVLIGTAKVPLVPLETKCTLHESFDLADEKKKMVGGKVEVKVRVRNPIVSKHLEKVTEKWLVIDGF